MNAMIRQRNEALRGLQEQLPGSVPYDNVRPINVPARCDGMSLFECVCLLHPHVSANQWQEWFRAGHILLGEMPVAPEIPVRGGQQYRHLFPDATEPEVDAKIEILAEEPQFVVVYKPAPLPVHPCGRFNRNTLSSLLDTVYPSGELRLVHRLDANTSGVMVLARTRSAATDLRQQFELNQVKKQYLVCCVGHPTEDKFICEDRIAKETDAGGSRAVSSDGHDSRTRFRVIQRCPEGTTLLLAFPETGRTNQIRVHLWALEMPVLGDPTYLAGGQRVASQTLLLTDPPMCLHAQSLSFRDPGGDQPITFVSRDPDWVRGRFSIPQSGSDDGIAKDA